MDKNIFGAFACGYKYIYMYYGHTALKPEVQYSIYIYACLGESAQARRRRHEQDLQGI